MRKGYSAKKGRYILEYALLIGVVAGALLYMQNYFKRNLQGRYQEFSDQLAAYSAEPFQADGVMYAAGLTQQQGSTDRSSSYFQATLPGWNHPLTIGRLKGKSLGKGERKLKPLR